ncbi:MAG TPA: LamG-like jellyroll fold domain-containing protein [Verrucomicrobiae bacterium]|nr:LamG-like jellyroll fold domain-containing protein [Verrucomicrobiae bacterium]
MRTLFTCPALTAFLLLGIRAAGAADYPTTILADHPLAYYRLEETSGFTAADSSASGLYPASYIFSPDSIYPVLGGLGITTNSITLSASDTPDYVALDYNADFNQPGPFSFEVWARPASFPTGGNYRCPIGNSPAYGTMTQSGWYVYQTPDVPSELALVTPTGDVFITSTNYSLFKWFYIAGTYDGTNMSFYLNGALVGTQRANAYVANSVHNAGACSFAIGQRGDGYGNFDGGLDEAAFYTNALSSLQISNHYAIGTNSFRIGALPPSILTQPAPATVYAGHAAQFAVQADGTAPLTYQWFSGTNNIPGATGSTYSFICTPDNDGQTYGVVVGNSVQSVTSSVVTLSVSTALQIDAPLTAIIRNVGSAAAFEVVAEGALPITYQWYHGDGTIVANATNNVLWLYNVQLADDGSTYYVDVINPYTDTPTAPVMLNVQARAVNVSSNGYAKMVLADRPVAYWRLDEPTGSTTAVDAVGSFDGTYAPNSGTFTFNTPTGIPHDADTAIGMTGGAVVTIPYSLEINPVGAFSVDGWFKASSATTGGNDYRTVFSSISNPYGAGPSGWLVYQTAANNWSWWPYNGFYAGVQLTDLDQVVPNQWYHLALVYDGTTFTFYVNGVAKASGTDPGFTPNGNVPVNGANNYNYNYNTTPGLPVGSGNMVLGQRVDNSFNPFSGTIDDVAVYNKALTAQQVQNHFLNATLVSGAMVSGKFVISWPAGTLQSATNIAGPFLDVSGATSPYTNSITGKQLFFRSKM